MSILRNTARALLVLQPFVVLLYEKTTFLPCLPASHYLSTTNNSVQASSLNL